MIFCTTIDYDDSTYTSCVTPDGKYHILGVKNIENKLIFHDTSNEPKDDGNPDYECILPTPCSVVQINGDGRLVAAGGSWDEFSNASHIYVFNTSTRELVREFAVTHQYFEISPDGNYLTVNDNQSNSGIYWVSNGSIVTKFSKNYELLKFSPDSRFIAAYNNSVNSRLEIFSFPDLERVYSLAGAANFSLCPCRSGMFSWSADGQYLAAVLGSNNTIRVFETSTWMTIYEITTNHANLRYTFVSFAPNGTALAVGGSNLEKAGISLGLQLYETTSWSKVYDEPNQIDYEFERSHNNLGADEYPIFETISWLPDGSVFISATYYKPSISYDSNPGPDDLEKIYYSIIFPLILVSIVIVVLVSIYGFLFYFKPYFGPWYSKLKPYELKTQITRSRIIQVHPGCIFSEIKRSIESSYSNVYYHLSVLEREELIFSKTSRFKKRFYSINYPKFSSMFPQTHDHGIHEKIFMLLLTHPGLTQKEIAISLRISEATVSRYIIDLLTENFIRREREGKVWKCYANPHL